MADIGRGFTADIGRGATSDGGRGLTADIGRGATSDGGRGLTTDVAIIGGGTAGLTAAIYVQRSALRCIVMEAEEFGGRIFPTLAIDNYPAVPGVSGFDFCEALRAQAEALGAELSVHAALSLSNDGNYWEIATSREPVTARAVILATGEKRRPLGIPGEAEFLGRGVAACAACDGAFFKGKDVAVIGGGDKALDDALTLSRLCTSVRLIHRRDSFRAAGSTVALVKAADNVTLYMNSAPVRIDGNRRVESLTIRGVGNAADIPGAIAAAAENTPPRTAAPDSHRGAPDVEETLAVSGVFVAIGSDPLTSLIAGLVPLDRQGYAIAGEDCLTPTPGLFVAGDVRAKPLRQLVTAAADGAVAGKAASDYVTLGGQHGR